MVIRLSRVSNELMNSEVCNGHLGIEIKINNVTFIFRRLLMTKSTYSTMPMRGGPSFTSCSMSFPQQQKTLECLPRHCNNKSEVCHHRCHYYPKHKLTQCAHQGTQWVVVGVVRHDGFHCQNTYMLLIVGVQSTVFDNFQKCLVRILAFSTNFCSIKIDLPGNTV